MRSPGFEIKPIEKGLRALNLYTTGTYRKFFARRAARKDHPFNCNQEECAPTTSSVSLGFLVLEVHWPRFARTLSTNEDFSGISGTFRSFDANSDDRLSVDDLRECEQLRRSRHGQRWLVQLRQRRVHLRPGAQLRSPRDG